MNIVFVTRNMHGGGAERVISELLKYLTKQQISCKIVTLEKEKVLYHIPPSVELHMIGEKSGNRLFDKYLRYKELRNYVKGIRPDLVVALPEEIGIYVIPALFGTKIPVVVSERNNPWVMPWKKGTRLLRSLCYPHASGLIFQTEQAAGFFSNRVQRKGIVLPNPLDLTRLSEPWVGGRRKEIVGAGRLDKQKNFPLLIKAFAQFYENHSDYKLIIYGEGILQEELIKLANSLLPSEAYSFPGRTTRLLEQINGASMFVLSSDYEGLPNVVIEAMALGLPVISTDCPSGGPSNLIEDGKNGILIPVGNVQALYKAMCRLAENEDYAAALGKQAQKIKNKFNSEVVSEKWRGYFNAVAKQ